MRSTLTAVAMALGIVAGAALPAAADPTDDSITTFAITAGSLNVTVPASKDLGSGTTGANTISAQLGTITIADTRGALLGTWTTTVSSSDFVTGGGTAAETISAAAVTYWSGPATASSGVATRTPGQANAAAAQTLDTPRTAFSATLITGNNSTSWNPTVTVNVPSAVVAGSYTGTITHSVA